MEYDLRRELGALSREPVPGEDTLPMETVTRRVRRGHALRVTGIGAVAAATVLGLAVAVQAAPWEPDPVQPAVTATPSPSTTPSATAQPSPQPTAQPTPEPTTTQPTATTPPVVATPPIVGVTTDGAVVTLDPGTGAVLTTLYRGVVTTDPSKVGIDISPDGTVAYVSQTRDGDRLEILRIDVATGTSETIASGVEPAVSPDGRTLAYAGRDPAQPEVEGWGLNLLDVTTGSVRHLPEVDYHSEAWISTPVWSSDGDQLFLPTWRGLLRVDVSAGSLGDAVHHPLLTDQTPRAAALVTGGPLAVNIDEGGYFPDPATMHLALVDEATGQVFDEIDDAAGLYFESLSSLPDGQGLIGLGSRTVGWPENPTVESTRLYRWDGGEAVRELTESPGLVAVTW